MKSKWIFGAVCASFLTLGMVPAQAQNVKITSLGSVSGELCALDRAILFEDPSGVRILIQPGRTVDGSTDARLGDVHVVLVDHAHGDHIGDFRGVGCTGGGGVDLKPGGIPNIAEIAAGKDSAVLVGGELTEWLLNRVSAAEGVAVGRCGGSGLTTLTEVSRTQACVDFLRPGASRELMLNGTPTGVHVSTIPVVHANGIPAAFIDGATPAGLTGYGGTETGYVIRFSNGLSVLWSGDSGFFGDMKLFSQFYKVNLAIMHIGNIFTMGPDEAAFAVNTLIKPKSVIPTHVNEVATAGGVVQSGSKTERFIQQVGGAKVVVPLSDVPIYCDGTGKCMP